jgi:hypothetical protein
MRQIKHKLFTTLNNKNYRNNTPFLKQLGVSDYDTEVFMQFFLKEKIRVQNQIIKPRSKGSGALHAQGFIYKVLELIFIKSCSVLTGSWFAEISSEVIFCL